MTIEIDKLCEPDCMYLDPKEVNQANNYEPHMCTRYGMRVYHFGHHPNLVRCLSCSRDKMGHEVFDGLLSGIVNRVVR